MSQVPSGTGQWLKASDVAEGTIVTIKDEANWIKSQYNGEDQNQYVVTVDHEGEDKRMKITMASCNYLRVMGADSKDWIGKKIKLKAVDVMVGGKMKKSMLAQPAEMTADQAQAISDGQEVPWDE